jgi:ribose transport system substrate-binding protein
MPPITRSPSSPGGPHPYFAPWEQAAADAKKDVGITSVDFKLPSDWKLNLRTELIESPTTQGYNVFRPPFLFAATLVK